MLYPYSGQKAVSESSQIVTSFSKCFTLLAIRCEHNYGSHIVYSIYRCILTLDSKRRYIVATIILLLLLLLP